MSAQIKSRIYAATLVALSLVLVNLPASAGSYVFRESDVSKGMLQKTTTALFVSSRGKLWIGTQQGLHAYTGVAISSYYYEPGRDIGLRSDYISAIAEMKDGTIVIGTRDEGIYSYDPYSDMFQYLGSASVNEGLEKSVYAIHVDSANRLWVGTSGTVRVLQQNIESNAFDEISAFRNDPGTITGFAETRDGVWSLSTVDGLKLHSGPRLIGTSSIPLEAIFGNPATLPEATGLNVDSTGNLWVWSLRHGLVAIDPTTKSVIHRLFTDAPGTSTDISVFSLIETAPDKFLVATSRGPFEYIADNHRLQPIGETFFSEGAPTITTLTKGLNGTIWAGTLYGPVSGTPKLFDSISSLTTALHSDSINAIAEQDGEFWLATDNGLTRLNKDFEAAETFNELTTPRLSDPTVMAVAGDENGVWVGTYSGGLNYLKFNGEPTQIFRSDKDDSSSVGANGITSILVTQANHVLVGTYGGGLNIYDRKTGSFKRFLPSNNPNSISSDRVLAIFQCSLGNIYVGTESGLNIFDESNGTFTKISASTDMTSGLRSDFIWSFFEDSSGDLWIASYRGGITRWQRTDRLQGKPTFTHAPSEISNMVNTVNGVAEDPDGYIWLSHNGGVTRISKDFSYVREFGINDGLLDTEFNVGAALTATDGTVFFGGNRGVNLINPSELPGVDTLPQVSISEVLVMNERVLAPVNEKTGNRTVNLSYNDRLLEVNFYSSYLSDPQDVQYGFFMEGVNNDWVIGKERHSASFTTLPAGAYKLRLAAANPSGAWNWDGPVIEIAVSPPPWFSPTAYTAYAAALFGAVLFLIYRLREKDRQQAAARAELEGMVRQRTEELEIASKIADDANKAKSQFLAAMSHEIRTPMHGILGMLELLQATKLDGNQVRYAKNATRSGKALLGIINDILDFSKLEASRVELESRIFNVNKLIEGVCLLQAAAVQKKDVLIVYTALPAHKSYIIGDEVRLGQCITNLVSNATKFTDSGRIMICPNLTLDIETGSAILEISVRDDGIGMDDATQAKVFHEFTQADTSTTRRYGGTGLGLSITKQFIDLMGGNVEIESAPGTGTTVTLKIPTRLGIADERREALGLHVCIVGDEDDLTLSIISCCHQLGVTSSLVAQNSFCIDNNHDVVWLIPQSLNVDKKNNGKAGSVFSYSSSAIENAYSDIQFPIDSDRLRDLLTDRIRAPSTGESTVNIFDRRLHALVAEDVPLNQRIAEENLLRIGINVTVVADGRDAVVAFEHGEFDIIFMDCHMPRMDGYAAARKIRALEAERNSRRIPIIALTAGRGSGDEQECHSAGMDAILLKPFTVADLKDAIAEHVSNLSPTKTNLRGINSRPSGEQSDSEAGPAIDHEVLQNFREVAPDNTAAFVTRLAQGFEQQMTSKIAELFDNNLEKTNDQIRSCLHAMKSMSTNMGAVKLTTVFANLESDAKSGSLSLSPKDKFATQALLQEYLHSLHELIVAQDVA